MRAHAVSSCAAYPPQRQRVQSRSRACYTRGSHLRVGGLSWQVTPQSHTEVGRASAGAVRFCRAKADYNQHGRTRTYDKLECCASSSPDKTSTVAHACACFTRGIAATGCALAAGTPHHGRSPKETGLPPAQRPSAGYTLSAIVRCSARAANSRAAPPPQRQRTFWRSHACFTRSSQLRLEGHTASAVAHACACFTRCSRLRVGSWHVAPRPLAEGGRPFAVAASIYSDCAD